MVDSRLDSYQRHREGLAGKRVLVVGHSGFKGSWLSLMLASLGCRVFGYSNKGNVNTMAHDVFNGHSTVESIYGDVRDLEFFQRSVSRIQPDVVFYLAAQPIVRLSLHDPVETFSTNLMGMVHMLEILRRLDHTTVAVLITSDKVYENREWIHSYRETDVMRGKDPYSSSKVMAEAAIASYHESGLIPESCRFSIARAGNVIGGGDWSAHRLIPDSIRAWINGEVLEIRQPDATRPWQHVIDPLFGYLDLAVAMTSERKLRSESFNFGPDYQSNRTVLQAVETLSQHLPNLKYAATLENEGTESKLLQISSEKAGIMLGWRPRLDFDRAIAMTGQWYRSYFNGEDCYTISRKQIEICYEL